MGHNQISLTEERRAELILLHRGTKERRDADRIKAILMLDSGYTHQQVSDVLLIDADSIRKYEKKFSNGGVERLLSYSYTIYTGKLTDRQCEELKAHLQDHVYQHALEVRDYIQQKYKAEYTHDGVIKLLHRLGFSYKKMKGVPAKADREAQKRFVRRYKTMRKSLKKTEKIYFMDASHPVYNSVPSYAWIETGTEKELPQVSGRDRVNINGLYSPIDGETIIRMQERVTGTTTLELIKAAKAKHPELTRIIIIHDNSKAYHARYLKEHLPPGVMMVALPPYSPNLNLIERLWKYFREEVMNNKYHESFLIIKQQSSRFFRSLHHRRIDLKSLMTENFHLVGC